MRELAIVSLRSVFVSFDDELLRANSDNVSVALAVSGVDRVLATQNALWFDAPDELAVNLLIVALDLQLKYGGIKHVSLKYVDNYHNIRITVNIVLVVLSLCLPVNSKLLTSINVLEGANVVISKGKLPTL